jgi:hypothetical protein
VFFIFIFDHVDFKTIIKQLVHPGFLNVAKVTYKSTDDASQLFMETNAFFVLYLALFLLNALQYIIEFILVIKVVSELAQDISHKLINNNRGFRRFRCFQMQQLLVLIERLIDLVKDHRNELLERNFYILVVRRVFNRLFASNL